MHIPNKLINIINRHTSFEVTKEEKIYFRELDNATLADCDSLLLKILTGIRGGTRVQRHFSRIYRHYASIQVLSLFGFSSTVVKLSEELLQNTMRYDMHQISSNLCLILSKHYAVFDNEMSLASSYHEQALAHNKILRREMIFDWKYQKIRARYGSQAFWDSEEEISSIIFELKSIYRSSVWLMFVYHELKYFRSYIQKDLDQQRTECQEAIKSFKNIPFQHDSIINIFTFHLINVLLDQGDLATAELIILQCLDDNQDLGNHFYRYQQLLAEVYIRTGQIDKAEAIVTRLRKRPAFKHYKKKLTEMIKRIKEEKQQRVR